MYPIGTVQIHQVARLAVADTRSGPLTWCLSCIHEM